MSSSLFVPDALKFYVSRLSFSKNRVRLQALSSQVASANSQIIVRLPSNTMINLASLTMAGVVRASILVPDAGEGVGTAYKLGLQFYRDPLPNYERRNYHAAIHELQIAGKHFK
jgi:hypothetical protein